MEGHRRLREGSGDAGWQETEKHRKVTLRAEAKEGREGKMNEDWMVPRT